MINPGKPKLYNKGYGKPDFKEDFGHQYRYFKENIDDKFPKPLVKGLNTTFFSDSDHGHDKVTGRSITAILGMVGNTPVIARSTRQSCVQTST